MAEIAAKIHSSGYSLRTCACIIRASNGHLLFANPKNRK